MRFSKNTLKLLKLFYAHPDQEFYIQQLGRILKKKPGVFQRTLYNLEKDGVLRSDYKANARYFRANKNYSLYNEFKSIVHKIGGFAVIITVFNFLSISAGRGFCEEKKSEIFSLSSPEDAIKIAFRNNKDVQIEEYGLKIASADILNAKSEFLPKVNFNSGYTHNGAVPSSPDTTGSKKDNRIFFGYKDNNMMGVSVNDTIYNGGANLAALRRRSLP